MPPSSPYSVELLTPDDPSVQLLLEDNKSCFFLQDSYLTAQEKSVPGLSHHFIRINQAGADVFIAGLQLLEISTVSFMKRLSLLVKEKYRKPFYIRLIALFKPRIRVLVMGNLLLNRDTSLLPGSSTAYNKAEMIQRAALEAEKGISSVCNRIDAILVKDIRLDNDSRKKLLAHDFLNLPVEPHMSLYIDKSWRSIDDYAHSLKAKYRQKFNQVHTETSEIESRPLAHEEMQTHKQAIYKMHLAVVNDEKFNLAPVSEDYFLALHEAYRGVTVWGYFYQQKLCAFRLSINDGETLEAHYIGYLEPFDDAPVYHRMLFDFIKEGIEKKCHEVSFARTATEIKSSVGAVPEEISCYIRATGRVKKKLLRSYLARLEMPQYTLRHPFKEPARLESYPM